MNTLPDAVTFDFHNTIAICDEWFRLEVYDLLPEFIRWYASDPGRPAIDIDPNAARARYREIRGEIMNHGYEKDAVSCVLTVYSDLGLTIDTATAEEGVREIMCETLPDSRPVPGVVESVRNLYGHGIRLGVVSSAAYHPFLEWSLEKFGIRDAFSTVITSASSGFYKSRTEIYTIAAETLGSRPEAMVHIGDSPEWDVKTAARTGMATVLFDPRGEFLEDPTADSVVTSLEGVDQEIIRVYQRTRV